MMKSNVPHVNIKKWKLQNLLKTLSYNIFSDSDDKKKRCKGLNFSVNPGLMANSNFFYLLNYYSTI